MSGESALPGPGDRVGSYRITRELARGGMAVVYAAASAGGPVALKLPLPQLACEPRFRDLFLDEARIAAHVRHENVVRLLDVGDHAGTPFLVMDYVHGITLSRALESAAIDSLSRRERCAWVCAVLGRAALGLHAAHHTRTSEGGLLGIVHRDVSPQNVLIGYDGRVRLADFGIANAQGRRSSTRTGELRGKLRYLAPEQITREHPVSPQTDLFALGVVIWEALTKQTLFADDSDAATLWNITTRPLPEQPAWIRQLSPALADLMVRCLAREPGRRPRNAQEVAERLLAISRDVSGKDVDVAALVARCGVDTHEQDEDALFPVTRPHRTVPPELGKGATRWRRTAAALFGTLAAGLAIFASARVIDHATLTRSADPGALSDQAVVPQAPPTHAQRSGSPGIAAPLASTATLEQLEEVETESARPPSSGTEQDRSARTPSSRREPEDRSARTGSIDTEQDRRARNLSTGTAQPNGARRHARHGSTVAGPSPKEVRGAEPTATAAGGALMSNPYR